MAKQKTLRNPPIREALLDIRVVLPSDFDEQALEKYHNEVKGEYPIKEINIRTEAALQKKGTQVSFRSNERHNGYRFRSQINDKLIQFRKDGFTFNKLKPYTNWEAFSSEARMHWENYLKITKIKHVNRISLRYIDVIHIPFPFKDLKEYILTLPEIAPGLPQNLQNFFVRLVIPEDNKTNNIAIITETIDVEEFKNNTGILPVIFDSDVYNETNTEANTDLLWESFDRIRKYKNRIFFESLTEKTVQLLEK